MKNILSAFILSCALFAFTACGTMTIEQYNGDEPALSLREYFNGPLKAWGVVQDRSGNIIRRFDIDMVGEWTDNQGVLTEDFTYYDNETQRRVWHITDLGNGDYEGRASDIIDTATGKVNGNAGYWTYAMDVPVDGKTIRLQFDDYMWLMNDGVLVNRSYMKKFGVTVGEITIFMQKQ